MRPPELHKPHIIAVIGLPGAGKTFFASKFSDMFAAPFLDFSHYTYLIERQEDANELANYTFDQMLRTKRTLVIEGKGDTVAVRENLIKQAKKNGYAILFVWIQVDRDAAEHRSTKSKTATLTAEEFKKRADAFESLGSKEPHVVISGKHTYQTQARTVLKKLIPERPEAAPAPAPVPRTHTSVTRFNGRLLR